MSTTPQQQPQQQPTDTKGAGWIIAIVILCIIGLLGGAGESSGTSADPCSDEVLDAPYETGSEYMYRDQAGERAEACLSQKLDEFGD